MFHGFMIWYMIVWDSNISMHIIIGKHIWPQIAVTVFICFNFKSLILLFTSYFCTVSCLLVSERKQALVKPDSPDLPTCDLERWISLHKGSLENKLRSWHLHCRLLHLVEHISPLAVRSIPYLVIMFLLVYAVIDGLAGLVNARWKSCLDLGIKIRRVNKGSNQLVLLLSDRNNGG